jgi:hypothetical protein
MPFRRVLFVLETIVVPDFRIPSREEKNTNNAIKKWNQTAKLQTHRAHQSLG